MRWKKQIFEFVTYMLWMPLVEDEHTNLTYYFRKSSFPNVGSSSVIRNRQLDGKRIKPDGQVLAATTPKYTEKMIELDFVSSDDEDF